MNQSRGGQCLPVEFQQGPDSVPTAVGCEVPLRRGHVYSRVAIALVCQRLSLLNIHFCSKIKQLPSPDSSNRERSGPRFRLAIKAGIPASYPRRRIRKQADHFLDRLNPTLCALCASEGRPSVQPEYSCWLHSFKRSMSSAPSGFCLISPTTFCCMPGLSSLAPLIRFGNRLPLLRIACGCSMTRPRAALEKLMGAPEDKPFLSHQHFRCMAP